MRRASDPARPSVAELVARAEPTARRRRRPRQRTGWRRVGRRVFTALVLVALLAVSYYVGLVAYADSEVTRADILRPTGPEITLDDSLGAANFLVVGSDREGQDTVMLAHVGADAEQNTAVVFPGNAYVDVPACTDRDGVPVEPYGGAFSSVFDDGGPACLVRTVQVLTGLRVDHYVELDLAGFPAMVDALGGVPLCLDAALRDPAGDLDLPAGESLIDGAQTLPFLRLRVEQGPGEEERIRRQQQFLGSVVDRALSPRTVVDPVRLTDFLRRTARALTLDPNTSLRDLRALADLLTDLGGATVPLLTAPLADPDYQPVAGGPAYALLDDNLGRQLYRSIVAADGLAVAPGGNNADAANRANAAARRSAAPAARCS